MTILVTGATGNVGREAVRLLAESGKPARAFVRDPGRAPAGGVEVAVGNLDDAAALDAAMRGVETVVLVSPAVPAQEIAAVDAAVRAGVGHVVKATSKASPNSPVERRRGQASIEEHLRGSGLAWTLLRSNAYMQNLLALAPQVRASGGFAMSAGDGETGMVDARDVAAVAVAVALDPSAHPGRTYWLTGPTLVTYDGVAATLSDALGRPVKYRRVAQEEHHELLLQAGVPAPVAASNIEAFRLIGEGDAAWLTDDVQTLTGKAPRGLEQYIADTVAAFR